MLVDVEYFKVLRCNSKEAEVYYVSDGMSHGDVLHFEKAEDGWKQTNWKTVWSASGSASGVVYPYWWHFIYGGL